MKKKLTILATAVLLTGLASCKKTPIVTPESSASDLTTSAITSTEPSVDSSAEHEHSWGTATVTKEATHTEEGEKTRTCLICGETKTETIEKIEGHTFGEWTTTKEATHTEEGTKERTCACGEKETETIEKVSTHEYGEWTITKEATHTEEGSKERTCPCGDKEVQTIDKTTEHNWRPWNTVTAATCIEDGLEKRVCACGAEETQPIPSTGHNFRDWHVIASPTHYDEGKETRTCSNCGEIESRNVPATSDHEYGEWVVTKEATCTEKGKQQRTCPCGQFQALDIDPTGHSFGDWSTVAPSCGVDGYDKRTCSKCGEEEKRNTVPGLEHDLSAWKTNDKDKHYKTCTLCGETVESESHNWVSKGTTNATCYEGGYDIYECSVCGKQETRNETEALGHLISVSSAYCYTSTEHWENCIRCDDTERLAHDFTADHPMWCKTCGYYGGEVTAVHGSILIDLSMTKDLKLTFNDSHSYKITVVSGTVSKPLEFYTEDRTKNEVSIGELHGFYKDTEYIFSAGENKSGVIKIELAGHTLDWDGKCLYCKQDVSVAATLGKKYTLDIDANMADVYKYSLTGPTRPVLVMDDYSQLDDYSALRTDNQNFLWENNMNWSGFSITTSGSVTGYLKLKAKADGTGIHSTMYLAQNVFSRTKSTKVEDGRLVINGISAVSFNGSKQIGIIYKDLTIRYFTVYNFEDMDNPGSGSCDAGGDLMVYLTPVDGGSVTTTGLSSANYFYKS